MTDFETKYFEGLDKRLENIEAHLEELMAFKWKLIGVATSLSVIVSVAVGMVVKYL